MSKALYTVRRSLSPTEGAALLRDAHYLGKQGARWKNGYNYVLESLTDGVVGVCIFTSFPVPELVVGMFGLARDDQDGMFELSRLVLCPVVQKQEHNLTSFFVSAALRALRKDTKVRCVLSYADSDFHSGIVYRACNFEYYGLTEERKDFFIKTPEGWRKHQRGPTRGVEGEWRPRSRKHRFVIVYDKELKRKMKWEKICQK